MTPLTLDKKRFLRTIVLFLALTIAWTILAIVTHEFTDRDEDKGIITIGFRLATILLTCLFLLAAYFIDYTLSKTLDTTYNFHPRLTTFNLFQLALIIPLTLGMTLKKAGEQ